MKLTPTHKYDDIIQLSRPQSRRARMSKEDRAAQFSPFAALTGFDSAIEETGRLTECRIDLDEHGKQLLDQQMRIVLEVIHTQPEVTITWFSYDIHKAGGHYLTVTGCLKKIDRFKGILLLAGGQTIPLEEVFSIRLESRDQTPL